MANPTEPFYDAIIDARYPGRDGDTYSTRDSDGRVTRVYRSFQAYLHAGGRGENLYVAPAIYNEQVDVPEA